MSKLMTPAEAAAALGVSTRTLQRYVANGDIRPIVLPSGHRRYDIDAYLDELSEQEGEQ